MRAKRLMGRSNAMHFGPEDDAGANPANLARIGDTIECDVREPTPHTIRLKLETWAATYYANELLAIPSSGWRLSAGVQSAPDNRTAAEIHGCDVMQFSNQQCVHGTYGCTAAHGVPSVEAPSWKHQAQVALAVLCVVAPTITDKNLKADAQIAIDGLRDALGVDPAAGLSGEAWSAVTKRCFDTGGNSACADVSPSRCTLCPNRTNGVRAIPQPRHDDGSPAPEDTIAKCKRILAAVDSYHDNPTQATRSDLRHAIYDELERAASGVEGTKR
jgi:hypothetical protein